jgi:hypothetical protein
MNLIYISLFVFLSAYIDYEHLKDNDYIESHISRWCLRALFVIAVSTRIEDVIGMTLFFAATFDHVLNYLRGKELFYLGTVAIWDQFWSKIPFLFIAFKITSLFVGIFLLLL